MQRNWQAFLKAISPKAPPGGGAAKYLNMYNALFAASYNNSDALAKLLCHTLLDMGSVDHYHGSRDVQEQRLLPV